jgi:hypothetical protein
MHYKRWQKHGDPEVRMLPGGRRRVGDPSPVCSVEGCDRDAYGHGWCRMHWMRWYKHGDPLYRVHDHAPRESKGCRVDGCERVHKGHGYCAVHMRRWKKTGAPGPSIARSARTLTADGYVIHGPGSLNVDGYVVRSVPGHPNGSGTRGLLTEHRLVMATRLGRALYVDESVHHKNGDRADNRLDNLELRTRYHGQGQAVTDRIADAIFILERYAPELLVTEPVQLRVVA